MSGWLFVICCWKSEQRMTNNLSQWFSFILWMANIYHYLVTEKKVIIIQDSGAWQVRVEAVNNHKEPYLQSIEFLVETGEKWYTPKEIFNALWDAISDEEL